MFISWQGQRMTHTYMANNSIWASYSNPLEDKMQLLHSVRLPRSFHEWFEKSIFPFAAADARRAA